MKPEQTLFKVGDRVKLKAGVFEHADDYSPSGFLAKCGDILVVRHVTPGGHWLYRVSHEAITDKSFGVTAEEIEAA